MVEEQKMRIYNEDEVKQIVQSEARRQRIGSVLEMLYETYAMNPASPQIIKETIEMMQVDYGFKIVVPAQSQESKRPDQDGQESSEEQPVEKPQPKKKVPIGQRL